MPETSINGGHRTRSALEDLAVTNALREFDLVVADLQRHGISAAHLRSRIGEDPTPAQGQKDPSR